MKVVVSLYDDGFPGELDKEFGLKIAGEGCRTRIFRFWDVRHTKISAVSLWNMPTVSSSRRPDVDAKVLKFARRSGKPMLEYRSPEEDGFFDNYNRFYEDIQ